jgi:hypothetical protein
MKRRNEPREPQVRVSVDALARPLRLSSLPICAQRAGHIIQALGTVA